MEEETFLQYIEYLFVIIPNLEEYVQFPYYKFAA